MLRNKRSHPSRDAAALEAARVEFTGAKAGKLKAAQQGLGKVDKADKPAAGKKFNEVKTAVEAALRRGSAAARRLREDAGRARRSIRRFPAGRCGLGHLASGDANDRRHEGHHGPARLHRRRGPRDRG